MESPAAGRLAEKHIRGKRCTYDAYKDRDNLVQDDVGGLSTLRCVQEDVQPETHGSENAKEGELEAD